MFAPDELIAALADAGVDYILIGGLAVAAHGFPRATKDVDVVPAPDPSNLERLASLLRTLDAQHYGLGDFDPSEFPFDPHDLAFEHLSNGAVETSVHGQPVRVCSRDDLIAMKRAAGRPQDLVDLQELGG